MSKSFDFSKAAVSRSGYANRSWDNACEKYETMAIFDEYLHGARNFSLGWTVDNVDDICFDFSINFDSNADFDYFTSESCIHDGTFIFIRELIDRCVRKVCLAQSYYKPIGAPKSGDNIQYVIGNFVIITEYDGDFVPKDKPWMRERTTVLLPIKMMKS